MSRLAVLAAAAALSLGAAPGTWRHPDGPGLEGHAEDVSITGGGGLLLAPDQREILPGDAAGPVPPMLWSLTMDMKKTIFVGGGIGAQVIRVPGDGKPEPFFGTAELGIKAMVTNVTGQLFVATFPTGRVYRVDEDGSMEAYFEPEERYLWAMATDPFDRLYVATGERGIIYVVTGRGEGEVFMDSDEPHITSLATDPSGRLIAGSAGRGLLYRLDSEGRPELLLDSKLDEISSIAVASDGTIYAAALRGPGRSLRDGSRRKDDLTIEISPAPDDEILEEAAEPEPKIVVDLSALLPPESETAAGALSSVVYRIPPSHTPQQVWSSGTERVYAVALDARGHLLMGTGPDGRLYRLEPDGSSTLLRSYPAGQITNLAPGAGGETLVLTSNPGRLYALRPRPASSGRYLSPVRDAGSLATWGSLKWDADVPQGTRVDLESRSGNTFLPDSTWSGWSKPAENPRGSPLAVPAARYMQWRATLSRVKTEATPLLRSVTATYLPENLPPSVRNVRVEGPSATKPGEAAGQDDEKPKPAEPAPAGTLWLSWSSEDPSNDPLTHEISVRREEETSWRVLAPAVAAPPHKIDAAALPEGVYVARVVASDAGVNGDARALTAEARSAAFGVDKTAPVITPGKPAAEGGATVVPFTARDAMTSVSSCQWAEGKDGPWHTILPDDGIADTQEESCTARIPAGKGRASIFLRAADPSGNISTLEVQLP